MHTQTQGAFRGLADPTRREILHLLKDDSQSIADLVDAFDISRNAVVKHLAILEEGGLIATHAAGRERRNVLVPGGLKPAFDWLAPYQSFWDSKLDLLKAAVEESRND